MKITKTVMSAVAVTAIAAIGRSPYGAAKHAKRRFRPESKWRPCEEIAPAVPSSREAV